MEVCSLPPNRWGLYEMHGNVDEWCEDHWHPNYDGAPSDGSAWVVGGGAFRVLRGGSWYSDARGVRAAYRYQIVPTLRVVNVGFRCVRGHTESRAAEPAVLTPGRALERRPSFEPPSRAIRVQHRLGNGPESAPLPQVPALILRSDREEIRLGRMVKPDWASGIGRDRFGLFADLTVPGRRTSDITQRLRWIPPGRFLLGSPEGEDGRFQDEGPVHPVTIAEGFWLFDTPCTQALWVAVTGFNPSRFVSSARPVECVDFRDVAEFFTNFNRIVPGFRLPSEAQWEYACRAGSNSGIFSGELTILGANNAPALDPVAWYAGNSGVGFELDNGNDSRDWPDKQYPHTHAGTRSVGRKAANPWGLYDMLGNVAEWCEDQWHSSYKGAPEDGSAWIDTSIASRADPLSHVVRGGSWSCGARDVRVAARACGGPSRLGDDLGFRCARIQ
jgi:formylglycine-generating enzyme required for sulfatase activity